MPDGALARRIHETADGQLGLGNECMESAAACFVRCRETPSIWDANFACRVRAEDPRAIDAVLARADEIFRGCRHRRFRIDPDTPSAFEARLAQAGYALETQLWMWLEGPLRATPRPLALRPAETDADWDAVFRLGRIDHGEDPELRGVYREEVTRGLVARRRAKSPAQRTWIAHADGADVGVLSSWPGRDGLGQVEDLFTHPEARRRGVATALLAHGVADARARGARDVLIGARPDDTPRHLYARLGFRPACVGRSWRLDRPGSAG